jgi:hypothetical protein
VHWHYGAFGFGASNGQGLSRTETDDNVMLVMLATSPLYPSSPKSARA